MEEEYLGELSENVPVSSESTQLNGSSNSSSLEEAPENEKTEGSEDDLRFYSCERKRVRFVDEVVSNPINTDHNQQSGEAVDLLACPLFKDFLNVENETNSSPADYRYSRKKAKTSHYQTIPLTPDDTSGKQEPVRIGNPGQTPNPRILRLTSTPGRSAGEEYECTSFSSSFTEASQSASAAGRTGDSAVFVNDETEMSHIDNRKGNVWLDLGDQSTFNEMKMDMDSIVKYCINQLMAENKKLLLQEVENISIDKRENIYCINQLRKLMKSCMLLLDTRMLMLWRDCCEEDSA